MTFLERITRKAVVRNITIREGSVTRSPSHTGTASAIMRNAAGRESEVTFNEDVTEALARGAGDIIEAVSSTDGGHFHTIAAWLSESGALGLWTSYEYWRNGQVNDLGEQLAVYHDHRVMRQGDDFVLVSNEAETGPQHTVSGESVREPLRNYINRVAKDVNPEELIRSIPEYQGDNSMDKTEEVTRKDDDTKTEVTRTVVLTTEQSEFYRSLPEAEQADFLNLSTAEMDDMIGRASTDKDSPPIEYNGETFVRSEDPKSYAMVKRMKEMEERELNRAAEAEAVEVFRSKPGTSGAKAALHRAIQGISDEVLRKEALEVALAASTETSSMTRQTGVNSEEVADLINRGVHDKETAIAEIDRLTDEQFASATAEGKLDRNGNPISRASVKRQVITANRDLAAMAQGQSN